MTPAAASPRAEAQNVAATASSTCKTAAKSRVRKPAARTAAGTRIRNKKLGLIAQAETEAAAFNAADNNNSSNNSNKDDERYSTIRAPAKPREHVPEPRPADDVFPQLPSDANPIDRAIFARLALVWAEEAGRWTEAMRQSLLDMLPRARVKCSTACMANHYVSRRARQSGTMPTWGGFVVIRTMFGPAPCFRQTWATDFAERYPLAREDAYEGVVPDNLSTVRDVLEGKVGMPVPPLRKVSVMTLERERTRKKRTTGPAAVKKAEDVTAAAGGGGLLAGLRMDKDEPEDDKGEVSETVWAEAAASAGRMKPVEMIADLQRRYRETEAQIQQLREEKAAILEELAVFTRMADKVKRE